MESIIGWSQGFPVDTKWIDYSHPRRFTPVTKRHILRREVPRDRTRRRESVAEERGKNHSQHQGEEELRFAMGPTKMLDDRTRGPLLADR